VVPCPSAQVPWITHVIARLGQAGRSRQNERLPLHAQEDCTQRGGTVTTGVAGLDTRLIGVAGHTNEQGRTGRSEICLGLRRKGIP
jgi:hypothetical protein